MKKMVLSLVAGCVLVVSSFAEVLLYDDFESYSQGEVPGGSWYINEGTNSSIRIFADNAPGSTGTNAVHVIDGDATYSPSWDYSIGSGHPRLTVKFDYRIINAFGQVNFRVTDTAGEYPINMILQYGSSTNTIRYNDNGNMHAVLFGLTPTNWYHVELDISGEASNNVNLSITGLQDSYYSVTNRLNFVSTSYSVTNINKVDFRWNTANYGGEYVIDNVEVIVKPLGTCVVIK